MAPWLILIACCPFPRFRRLRFSLGSNFANQKLPFPFPLVPGPSVICPPDPLDEEPYEPIPGSFNIRVWSNPSRAGKIQEAQRHGADNFWANGSLCFNHHAVTNTGSPGSFAVEWDSPHKNTQLFYYSACASRLARCVCAADFGLGRAQEDTNESIAPLPSISN